MSKQLAPIGKAIEWCDEEIKEILDIQKHLRKTLMNNGERWSTLAGKLERCRTFKQTLESLLPEKKQLAKDAFNAGFSTGEEGFGDLFSDYYKKYEDEKET